jgi:sulfoxide reductase heme-binding subunit YedZ
VLHRLVYPAGILGVVHYWWLVKADVRRPETYALVVAILLAARVLHASRFAGVTRFYRYGGLSGSPER